jgi:hypothetical protein
MKRKRRDLEGGYEIVFHGDDGAGEGEDETEDAEQRREQPRAAWLCAHGHGHGLPLPLLSGRCGRCSAWMLPRSRAFAAVSSSLLRLCLLLWGTNATRLDICVASLAAA